MVAEADPANPRRLLAALKLVYDEVAGEDRAYLFLPGAVHVAARRMRRGEPSGTVVAGRNRRDAPLFLFDPRGWDWLTDRQVSLPHGRIPVVRFLNKYGKGEYETHLDALDRINHQILQRMVVATMQAFRQRAVSGLPLVYPEDHPNAGQEIDYSDVFTADPAALWQLPDTAKMWESQQVDLRPILDAVKDDLEHLASVTRTPMHMLSPAGVNQSAEGASLQREGLVFKTEDRIARTSYPWAQTMSLVLLHADQPDRADLADLETIWAPAERLSLAERAAAAQQLAGLLPKRTLLITVLGMSPAEADRTMTEIADEQLLAMQVQSAMLAATGAAPTTGGGVDTAAGPPPADPTLN